MKSLNVVLMTAIIMAPIFTLAQHQHQSAKEMMKDKAMQDSVMTMISKNSEMMDKMTMHIMNNKVAMHIMMQKKGMMKEMMNMADKDSTTGRAMMNMMMQHPDMMNMMMSMMMQRPEMMERMQGMMQNKGMMNKDPHN
ncbi:MAG TPA: hypothetical protein VMU83_16625 [Hanamia sp.]|nr:hypothetical protein [Hanamia sp.]